MGDDEMVLSKLIADLDGLNLHRTPLNCITLLKVLEVDFDDSPVNRTEVIRRVLFLLFNVDSVPIYKRRPDMKDCEHVLGWFCERLLRRSDIYFKYDFFIRKIKSFCKNNIIDLDIELLFDVLFQNNIIVNTSRGFCFKFTYWVMYFAAQRMHHNQAFRDFIFEDMRYASYPELIEFYTGIDRRRDDALLLLIDDIKSIAFRVKEKLGFPEDYELYSRAKWTPTDEIIENIKRELGNEVDSSNLPDIIKDEFADRAYNPVKPYDQELRNVVEDYLLELLTNSMIAGARALRNSDYAEADIKKELLKEILACWELIAKIVMVLSPVLAKDGSAIFEGTRFVLVGNGLKDNPKERFEGIFRCIPTNIVEWFAKDLYSHKMGPLFFDQIEGCISDLGKHYLALLLIANRPHNWKSKIEKYISTKNKNSFYLFDAQNAIHIEQKYGFNGDAAQKELLYLRKMAWAKHETGSKKPGIKLINKMEVKD